jgi:hypothetical protein
VRTEQLINSPAKVKKSVTNNIESRNGKHFSKKKSLKKNLEDEDLSGMRK